MEATELIVTVENRSAAYNGHKHDVGSIVFGRCGLIGIDNRWRRYCISSGASCSCCRCGSTAQTIIGCIQCCTLVCGQHASCDGQQGDNDLPGM